MKRVFLLPRAGEAARRVDKRGHDTSCSMPEKRGGIPAPAVGRRTIASASASSLSPFRSDSSPTHYKHAGFVFAAPRRSTGHGPAGGNMGTTVVRLLNRDESAPTIRGRCSTGLKTLLACGAGLLGGLPVEAVNEPIRELKLPTVQVEAEPRPELGFEPPPDAYPVLPVDQDLAHGVRSGFVTTTTPTRWRTTHRAPYRVPPPSPFADCWPRPSSSLPPREFGTGPSLLATRKRTSMRPFLRGGSHVD